MKNDMSKSSIKKNDMSQDDINTFYYKHELKFLLVALGVSVAAIILLVVTGN